MNASYFVAGIVVALFIGFVVYRLRKNKRDSASGSGRGGGRGTSPGTRPE